jgi:hypothetical protein
MMRWGQPRLMRRVKETVNECRSRMFDLVIDQCYDPELQRHLTDAVERPIADATMRGLVLRTQILLMFEVNRMQAIDSDR